MTLSRRAATGIGFCAVLLWSSLAVLTAASGDVPPLQLLALTFAIGGIAGVALWAFRPSAAKAIRQPWPIYLLGVGGLFGYHAAYFIALRNAPVVEAGLINYLWPLLIVLLAAPIAGEKLRWWHLAGAGLGLAGIVVLAFGRGDLGFAGDHWKGYLAALGCAFAWSLYSTISRRFGEVPTDAVAGFCVVTALLALPLHLIFETTVTPAGATTWLALAALGFGPVGAAFYLWDIAVKRGDIRALGALSYLTPILSTSALIIAGRAQASPSLLLATALVVAGAVLAARDLWSRQPG
jgi:drug/metabolite transporter (DMT)-like permease